MSALSKRHNGNCTEPIRFTTLEGWKKAAESRGQKRKGVRRESRDCKRSWDILMDQRNWKQGPEALLYHRLVCRLLPV